MLTLTLTLTPTLTLALTPTPTRCDALYCPSLNVMVFDHRPTEGAEGNPERDDPCIGKLSIPLASYCESTPNSPPNLP